MPKPITRRGKPSREVDRYCPLSIRQTVGRSGWISEFNRYKEGILPFSGGYHDQPSTWCQGIDVLSAEVQHRDNLELENAKIKQEQAGKRG